MLTHAPRQPPSWLIFDVGQKAHRAFPLSRDRLNFPHMLRILFLCLAFFAAIGSGISASADAGPVALDSEKARFDQPPVAISMPLPQYPFEMRRKGVEAEVVVEFTVDVEGRVRDSKVVGESRKEFHPAALTAIERAKFKPAMKDGRPVAVRLRVPLVFQLNAQSENVVKILDHRIAGVRRIPATKRPNSVIINLEIEYLLVSQPEASLRAAATMEGPTNLKTVFNRDVGKEKAKKVVNIQITAEEFQRDTIDVIVWLDKKPKDGGPTPEPIAFQKLTFDVSKL